MAVLEMEAMRRGRWSARQGMEMAHLMLAVEDVAKTYRRGVRANDGVTLSAAAGQVYGLLGHNGAGKTTLVNQVVGLLKPDRGSISVDGHDVIARPDLARRLCSIEPQSHVPIDGMTARQAIDLVGRLRGGARDDVRRRTADLIETLDIGQWADTDGARLSGGVRRLVSFCMATVVPGRVVILDEPTNDVDPVRRRLLWARVRSLADEGAAVLLVTHNVVEAERSVDRLAILDHGKVIVEGSPASLKETLSRDLRLELVVEPGATLPQVPACVQRQVRQGDRVVASIQGDSAADAVAWAMGLQEQHLVEEFTLSPATLEDAYIELVDRADADRSPAAVAATTGDLERSSGAAAP
jgi:ABC-2 type transport system ATP-binding protein